MTTYPAARAARQIVHCRRQAGSVTIVRIGVVALAPPSA